MKMERMDHLNTVFECVNLFASTKNLSFRLTFQLPLSFSLGKSIIMVMNGLIRRHTSEMGKINQNGLRHFFP